MKHTKNTFDFEIQIYYFLFWSKRSSSRVGSRKKTPFISINSSSLINKRDNLSLVRDKKLFLQKVQISLQIIFIPDWGSESRRV